MLPARWADVEMDPALDPRQNGKGGKGKSKGKGQNKSSPAIRGPVGHESALQDPAPAGKGRKQPKALNPKHVDGATDHGRRTPAGKGQPSPGGNVSQASSGQEKGGKSHKPLSSKQPQAQLQAQAQQQPSTPSSVLMPKNPFGAAKP